MSGCESMSHESSCVHGGLVRSIAATTSTNGRMLLQSRGLGFLWLLTVLGRAAGVKKRAGDRGERRGEGDW